MYSLVYIDLNFVGYFLSNSFEYLSVLVEFSTGFGDRVFKYGYFVKYLKFIYFVLLIEFCTESYVFVDSIYVGFNLLYWRNGFRYLKN